MFPTAAVGEVQSLVRSDVPRESRSNRQEGWSRHAKNLSEVKGKGRRMVLVLVLVLVRIDGLLDFCLYLLLW